MALNCSIDEVVLMYKESVITLDEARYMLSIVTQCEMIRDTPSLTERLHGNR